MSDDMIYFDYAATTCPKPRSVYNAVSRAMREDCGNPGRGAHRLSRRAAEVVFGCREAIAEFAGLDDPSGVVFTPNATAAINTAIKGVLREGDHVLISAMEHNAVYRPVYRLAKEGKISYDVFPTFTEDASPASEQRILDAIGRRIRPNTRAVVCAHASNLCSVVLPAKAIGKLCRDKGILFILDASQSLGHLPVSMPEMNIDVLCAPGHKGLYGPMGSGFLAIRPGLRLDTLAEGGNGVRSLEGEMPDEAPERYEVGTLAVPALAGLSAGVREVTERGVEAIGAHDGFLFSHLRDRLDSIRGVKILAPERVGSVLSFCLDGIPSERAADLLDTRGSAVRAGFHCSALGHRTLGTSEDGAVRVSFGMFNTLRETDRFAAQVASLLRDR